MKRIVCSFVLVLSLFSVHAQSQVTREEMQALVQRVDSLEHELSYLKLSNQFEELNTDLATFINEVNTKSVGIQLDLEKRAFDSELAEAYEQNYEACVEKMATIYDRIKLTKELFAVETTTKPYTELELSVLSAHCNVLNTAYKSLENAMNVLKIALNIYNEGVQVLSEY